VLPPVEFLLDYVIQGEMMRETTPDDAQNILLDRAARLPWFRAPDRVAILGGGKTNHNVLVADQGATFVVRFGTDIRVHGILRWNELAITRAAERAGLGPAVRYAQDGVMVLDYVDAQPITPADRRGNMVEMLADMVARVHRDVFAQVQGPVLAFHVFHILRDYARQLQASPHHPLLGELLQQAALLDQAVGPSETVLGHNDLLAGNILWGAGRLWLIDWEYAGLGNPLFDLGGIASNNGFDLAEERVLLETYYNRPLNDALWRRYCAMKAASLLRETLWSMVSEQASDVDFDYGAYTAENLAAYRAAYVQFQSL
jgi:thiamine kinase-like enzyme